MTSAADLIREARFRSGLSQREVARRAGTAQSVVARVESGVTSPTWETLSRLLAATGFSVVAELRAAGADLSHMLEDVPRILELTPEARLAELANTSRFLSAVKRA